MDNKNILELQHLRKYFPVRGGFFGKPKGYVHAVDDVTLEMKEGEVLGIVGETGCGKSTLGRTAIRLYKPTDGRIIFRGTDITNLSGEQLRPFRRDMQIIFQDPFSSLNPRMTVQAIVEEGLIVNKIGTKEEREEMVAEMLERVGIQREYMKRYPHEFSGGQRQRIGIARALVLRPKLIVCDEPVSALDVSIQSQVLNLLSDLKKEFGLSYLFISHDLSVVKYICDRVAVLYLGKVVEIAPTEELYAAPRHPYTKALLSAIPTFDVERRKQRIFLQGEIPSPVNPPSGCRFHPRCPLFIRGVCDKEVPKVTNISDNHRVYCHAVEKELASK